jgi:hypothetical protein
MLGGGAAGSGGTGGAGGRVEIPAASEAGKIPDLDRGGGGG